MIEKEHNTSGFPNFLWTAVICLLTSPTLLQMKEVFGSLENWHMPQAGTSSNKWITRRCVFKLHDFVGVWLHTEQGCCLANFSPKRGILSSKNTNSKNKNVKCSQTKFTHTYTVDRTAQEHRTARQTIHTDTGKGPGPPAAYMYLLYIEGFQVETLLCSDWSIAYRAVPWLVDGPRNGAKSSSLLPPDATVCP